MAMVYFHIALDIHIEEVQKKTLYSGSSVVNCYTLQLILLNVSPNQMAVLTGLHYQCLIIESCNAISQKGKYK
jgi:hypothetical protein